MGSAGTTKEWPLRGMPWPPRYSLKAKFCLDSTVAISEYSVVTLVYERPAVKGLKKMVAKAAGAMQDTLDTIAADPFAHHPNVRPLEGTKAGFRLRQGDWRAVYRIDRETRTMVVEWIGPRGEAYR